MKKLQDFAFHFVNQKRAGPVFRGLKMRFNFRKRSNRSLIHPQRFDSTFEMIGKSENGFLVVRIVSTSDSSVEHCVYVDAASTSNLESEEKHPIELTGLSWKMCAGPKSQTPYIAEVFELYIN